MATGIKKDGTWLCGIRRRLAANAVKGRRRLARMAGVVDPVDMRAMLAPDGTIRAVPLIGNDFLRFIVANVSAMSPKDVVALGMRHGLVSLGRLGREVRRG